MNSIAQPAPIVAPAVRSLDTLRDTLSSWLGKRMTDASDINVENLAYPRGAGLSHETILFDARWRQAGQERERGLVVRIKPKGDTVFLDDMFAEQYEIMRLMHRHELVRVAEPLWFDENSSLLGAPFFVMEKKTGRVPVSFPPYCQEGWLFASTNAQRRVLWEDSVRQLASIQRVPVAEAKFLTIGEPGMSGFEQELGRWTRYLDWISARGPLVFLEQALEKIKAIAPGNRPEGIVWGDARLGNMMFDDDYRVVAVMDWEQPSLGGALHDLAWWLYNEHLHTAGRKLPPLGGMGSRDETLALWSEVCGHSTADIEWYEAFAAFKMACLRVNMMDYGALQPKPGADFGDSTTTRHLAHVLGLEPPKPQPTRI